MTEPTKKAKIAYENKRTVKRVSFNNEEELELLEFAHSVNPSFSEWVKNKIREELKQNK